MPGRVCPSHLPWSARHVQSDPAPASVAAAQADLDTAVFDGYVSKGTKTAIQDQVEKSLKQMQGLLNSEHRDHINQGADRKSKESEIEKFVRERAAASGAAAGAADDDDDGPAVQQARQAAAHRLTRSHPPHAPHGPRPSALVESDTDLATGGVPLALATRVAAHPTPCRTQDANPASSDDDGMGSDGDGAATASKPKAPAKRAPASKAAKADAPARGRGRGRGAAAGRGRGRGAAAAPIDLSDDDDDGFGVGASTVSPQHLLPRRDPAHPCHPDLQNPLAPLQEQAPARSKRAPTAARAAATKRSRRGYHSLPHHHHPHHHHHPRALSATRASLALAPAGAKTPTTTQVTRTMWVTCSRLVLRRAARPSHSRASVA